jgi:uncharacterized protein YbjQ (UPF0145 family)
MEHTDMMPQQAEHYRRMAPAEKLRQLQSMIDDARSIKAAALRSFHPEWNELRIGEEVRRIMLHARNS